MEGGGPYAYPDPESPREVTGFEVELMALLGRELGVDARVLAGPVGQAAPGPRLGPARRGRSTATSGPRPGAASYLATRPYYVYQLQLMGPAAARSGRWADLKQPRPDGRRVDGRRAGGLGGRHLRGRAGRAERPRSSGSTAPPTR